MQRRRSLLAAALTALALCALAGAAAPARAQGITGAGSTFAFPVVAAWGRVYATLQGEGGAFVDVEGGLSYEPVGSTGGIARVISGAVDFGLTDTPLSPEELDRHALAQFPVVTGAVAVVTNLPGVASGALRVDAATLARIYLGEVTRWSDPALAALNPGLPLPDAAISPVRRSDGSGTTYNLAAYLASGSEAWRTRLGVAQTLDWPVGVGAEGGGRLAEAVRATPNAIGYVEAGTASRLGLAVALVQNRAGRFVAPTQPGVRAAAASAAWDPARHFREVLAGATAEDAYPIATAVFALVPRRPASTSRSRRTLEFFRMALFERAADAEALGYAPLPEPLARQVAAYWRATVRGAR